MAYDQGEREAGAERDGNSRLGKRLNSKVNLRHSDPSSLIYCVAKKPPEHFGKSFAVAKKAAPRSLPGRASTPVRASGVRSALEFSHLIFPRCVHTRWRDIE